MEKELNEEVLLPTDTFASEIDAGLSASPKAISSRYFYDAEGDRLFQKIMQLDEYYLSRAEYAIFKEHKELLLQYFADQRTAFHLMEFGAGDGWKTKVLLRHFIEQHAKFDYRPIDISGNVLQELESSLKTELPSLQVQGMEGEYFEVLNQMQKTDGQRKVVLFLGSNIGNFRQHQAISFLSSLRASLNQGDMVLIGFDMKKDPHVIRNAYDDASGVTRDFNMNLLKRLNIELGANFDLTKFKHYQSYDPQSGECRSYLISLAEQEVTMQAIGVSYYFKKWEPIHVEISRKFDFETINELAASSGFGVVKNLQDTDEYFTDSLWVAT
ncbi:L-histidine N(alpha)-methyltransferase [uncultured Imperialibacter sp.]|uniref:L-histidine N(alpha)-methyltransferase n=1 Tax=uncultured Imperialibacter sp. TaxID=1672639 RepID=UPI0030DA072A|tara:strand:+ start:24411 stop:25391 length:981 start_codon:yes stop_codon:yes gene_type:complete